MGSADAKQLDLVIVAPRGREIRRKGWLEGFLDGAVPTLAVDGIVYLLAFPFARAAALRQLRRRGLDPEILVAHVPDVASSRYLVPLDRELAPAAFDEVVPVWPRRRRLLSRVVRFPGAVRVFGWVLPSVAIVLRKEGARPLFDWLPRLSGDHASRVSVVVSGPPAEHKVVVLFGRSGAEQSPVVAKIGDAASSRLEREASILIEVGPGARMAGADVPKPLSVHRLAGRSLLFEDRLAGQSAAALLGSRPGALSEVLSPLADWLEAWNRSTVVVRRPEPPELRLHVLARAEFLANQLRHGDHYVAWLSERAHEVAAAAFPFVSAHNDLTMFNVLIGPERLGVVDWESAAIDQFPLTDFAYAAVDATSAAGRYEDRVAAFQDCFSPDGRHLGLVQPMLRRLATAVDASADAAQLSFHACWLHHAGNEAQKAGKGDERPFLSILGHVAGRRDEWRGLFTA
jgi:hypothetical protein